MIFKAKFKLKKKPKPYAFFPSKWSPLESLEKKDTIDFVDCGKLWCLKNAWKMGPLIRGFVKCEYFLTRGPMYYYYYCPLYYEAWSGYYLTQRPKSLNHHWDYYSKVLIVFNLWRSCFSCFTHVNANEPILIEYVPFHTLGETF